MIKQTLLLLALMGCLHLHTTAQVIFVKQDGTGTGTSWTNATGDLQYALKKAAPGTEIWVATGTYYPVDCTHCSANDRAVSFVIPDGVVLLGGFSGDENRHVQRNWQKNITTLSGNIGRNDCLDNSYNVIFTQQVSEKTIVDGFVITAGNANADAAPGHAARSGGGWYNDGRGTGIGSSPAIRNCVFLNNQALEGAGLFNNGDHANSSPNLYGCVFSGNRAVYGGGAIFNHALNGDSKPELTSCQFVNNHAAFGAGIFSACSEDLEPTIEHCTFVNNKAQCGGGLFYLGINYKPWLRTTRFLNNHSKKGEDVFIMKGKEIPNELLVLIEN